MSDVPAPVCPHARPVQGATPEQGGCVCKVMEADQARADSILEGLVPVFIRLADDPSTYFNLCAGQGEPVTTPEDLLTREFGDGHYTGCPVFAAQRELSNAERAFAPEERAAPGLSLQEQPVTASEERRLAGVLDRITSEPS